VAASGKKFYWMKLKQSFMTSETIQFFMMQKDGANYVVLYQMLCLMTINTNGKFSRQIGEVIIPYDIEKIRQDCKYFSADTIREALELYKKLGLIYEDNNGVLVLSNYENLVGSETDWAQQKRVQREAIPAPLPEKNEEEESDNLAEISQQVMGAWNALGLASTVKSINRNSTRWNMLHARVKQYGLNGVLDAIKMVGESPFLSGRVKDFQANFDWFIKPNNFEKVISGNYADREKQGGGTQTDNVFLRLVESGELND